MLGTLMHDLVGRMRARDWTQAGMLASSAQAEYAGTMLGPWLAGTVELNQGDLDSAEKHFRAALEVAPRSHRVITSLIAVWSRLKGPSWSAEQLLRLSERDPQFTYTLNIAALAFVEADQPSRAESVLKRAFTALRSSPLPYRDLAEYHLRLDRPSDALSVCADGLARFPADAELHLLSARGSADLGDREAAIRSYEAVLAVRPDHQMAASQLARLLVAAHKDEPSRARALQLLRQLALDAPSDAKVLGAMAFVALKAGDARRAVGWLEPAVRAASDEPSLRFQLASAYAQLGENDLARRELTAALQAGRAFEEEAEARRLLANLGGADAAGRASTANAP
jgi:Tfp pilus assembly protein PilF